MKKLYFFIVLLFVAFVPQAIAQNISNEGMEFWTVFPTHDPNGSSLATMNVNITSKSTSEVTVTCGTYSQKQSIPANTVVTFLVPRADSYIGYGDANQLLTNKGIHIVVTPGQPKVVAYSHIFASARSAATLILPYDALGQKYFSMNYTQDGGLGSARNFLVLVAAEDQTDIIVKEPNGTSQTIKLVKAGDVYEYMPSSLTVDLTGVYVEADPATSGCKRFAAFSGSTSVAIACNTGRDPLLQQLYSVNSWGKVYGVVPFINRRTLIRVLAQENQTAVSINGISVGLLNRGQYYEREIAGASIVAADKLISVAEYSLSQNCSSLSAGTLTGDPEMVLLNPIEFNIKNITVFSSSKERILEKYINVFMKTAKTATLRLNGNIPPGTWVPMPSDPTYSYIQIQVFEESLNLSADDGFNAIAYGFGQTESYAYSAGTNLASSQFLELVNNFSNNTNSTACIGQETDFKLTFPYLLSKIIWQYDDGSPSYTDNNPVYTTSVVNGQTLYSYTSPVHKIFSRTGTSTISATAFLANNTSSCISNQLDLSFTVEVNALALPNFELPKENEICAGAEVKLTDLSQASGGAITQWKWEIDGVIKTEKEPTFIFPTAKTYQIKLSVANAAGCWSDVLVKSLTVRKYLPQIVFNALPPICINSPKKQLAALETLGLSASKKVFTGDGVSANGLFDPAAAGVGVHQITYTFTSVDGCINTATQDIEVYALPQINLDKEIYILSGGQKVIPANIPNANPKYKYKWIPAMGLNRDDIANPIASPNIDTEYQLSVTIDGQCEVTAKVLVKVLGEINPPNAFSPNGDGVNDVWTIKSIDSYPEAVIQVFNRNGQKVFSSIGYAIPFDGTYKNERLPVGVYYYTISPKNGRKAITGPLTIIR